MKKILLLFTVIISLILGLSACKKKDKENTNWMLPPNVLYYCFEINGAIITDAAFLDSIKLFIIDADGNRVDSVPYPNLDAYGASLYNRTNPNYSLYDSGVCSGFWIGDLMGVQDKYHAKTFYFEFKDGNIDTLKMDSKFLSIKEGKKDECYCQGPFTKVEYNGKPTVKHPTLRIPNGKPVFVLKLD